MADLGRLIAAHVLAVSRKPAPLPRPAQCQLVTRVATPSVAAHVGVAAKDLFVSLDGVAAAELPSELSAPRSGDRRYVFYSRPRHELVELHTTGIDVGLVHAPTPDAVKARFDSRRPDYSALEVLWEARQFSALEPLAADAVRQTGARDTPALLFHGAALYESAREDQGMKLVGEYARQYAAGWTTNFAAIAFYYLGLDRLRHGAPGEALELLRRAYQYDPKERIAQALEKATGQRPQPPRPEWPGRRFPVDYRLPLLEAQGSETVALADALAAVPAGSALMLCLLASYRGNGPYADFMRRYANDAAYFGDFLRALHVVTEERERYPDRPHYFRAEDAARAAGLPVTLLFDERRSLSAALRQRVSPLILLLDRSAIVVYEGELDSVALWEALGRL